jgi:hypothetical protein
VPKMIDCKPTTLYVAGRIAESFKTDGFCSKDNSEKLIIQCRVLGGPKSRAHDIPSRNKGRVDGLKDPYLPGILY